MSATAFVFAKTLPDRVQAFAEPCLPDTDFFPICDDCHTIFRQHCVASLAFTVTPADALQRVITTTHIVLEIVQCGLQLRVAPIELLELGPDCSQLPMERLR